MNHDTGYHLQEQFTTVNEETGEPEMDEDGYKEAWLEWV
jgi:hypothetical protein